VLKDNEILQATLTQIQSEKNKLEQEHKNKKDYSNRLEQTLIGALKNNTRINGDHLSNLIQDHINQIEQLNNLKDDSYKIIGAMQEKIDSLQEEVKFLS
jgi:hypothetical protein